MKHIKWPKFSLLAMYSYKHHNTVDWFRTFGHTTWTHDQCNLLGNLFGQDKIIFCEMSFCKSVVSGLLFEVLTYGPGGMFSHIHAFEEKPIIAHMAAYVDNVDEESTRINCDSGAPIIHTFETFDHSNPEIAGKLRFKEAILGTRHLLGFDIKLMERLKHGPWSSNAGT